jgi:hypothetical protein
MNTDTLGLLSNVLYIALAFFALWIAGRMVLRNLSLLQNKISSSRAIHLAIWLALGEIFTLPLIDLLGLIQLITTLSTDETGEVYTLWGSVPPLIYDLCMGFTIVFIYSYTVILGWKPLFKRVPPISGSIQLSSFEKFFSLCALAGLVNHVVRFVFISIIWPQGTFEIGGFGKGIAGFFAGWLTGFIILAIAIYVMYELIAKKEDEFLETGV